MQGLLRGSQGKTLPPCRRPMVSRRFAVRCLAASGGFVIVSSLVALCFLFFLLRAGPINLDSLTPRIAQSLEERLGARYDVSIGSTYLVRMAGGIGLGFGGITLRDHSGHTVLSAPGGKVGLDALSLMAFDVKVHRLQLDGLDLRLSLRPDGALSIAAGSDSGAAPVELPAPAARDPATAAAPPDVGLLAFRLIDAMTGASQSLDRVELTNGHLEVENEGLGRKTVYNDLALAFEKHDDNASVRASAMGPEGRWSVEATAQGGDSRTMSLSAHDLSLEDVLLMHAGRPPFEADMPISFKVEARLAADSRVQALKGRFTIGAGYFKLDDPDHEPFLVDEATGDVAWDAETNRYLVKDLQLLSGSTHIFASGWLSPPTQAEPAWGSHFESSDTVFAPERPGEKPIAIDQAALDVHFTPADSRFVLDRLTIHGPNVSGEASAESAAAGEGATLKMNLRLGPSDLTELVRLWPSFINAEARNWCLQHIHGGQLASGSMSVDWDAAAFDAAIHKRAVPPASVHGEFSTRDTVVDLLPGVPPLTAVDANGVITGHEFNTTAKSAVLDLSPTRRIQIADLSYSVPDTTPRPIVDAEGGAHVQGSAEALADLLNRDALKHYAGFAIDPVTVKGQFEGKLHLDLKLGKTAHPEDNQFRAEGSLSNLRVDRFLASERLEQASLSVLADHGSLKIGGQGQMYGVPVAIDLSKGPTDEGSVALALSFDNAARAKLGLPGAWLMNGPMGIKVKAPLSKTSADIDVDLSRVALESPQTGLLKAAGKPGKATFALKPGDDGVAINAITVDAGSVSIRGTAQMANDGAIQTVKLSQMRLSAADDLKVDFQNGASVAKATVRGAILDARSLVKGFLNAGGPPSGSKDFDLDVKVANVIGANTQAVSQFELGGAWRAGVAKSMQIKGRIGNGTLSAQQDETGTLHAHVTDAGAMSKFLDIYSHMEGGTLELAMQNASEGNQGAASVTNFTLRNEPAMRQLAAAGAAGDKGAPLDPDATHFEKMSANFTRTPGRLELREAVIFNNQMGLTTSGFIDYAHDRVDLNGTFVPVYQVNSLVTHIPVVGTLLGGGDHEGIFGLNYRIVGPATGPTLTVNPLSAMTPGLLRKLFGAVDGTTPVTDGSATDAPLSYDQAPSKMR
jgi:hypothetical protein